jgi:putative flavoprotein involved in K+ transport
VRFRVNHYVTGRDGGRDIDLRAFARDGMLLYGHLVAVSGTTVSKATVEFAPDLEQNLDHADAVSRSIKDSIDNYINAHRIDAAPEPRYTPVWTPERETTRLDLHDTGITSVIWSTGFGRDDRWIEVPVFDGRGYPTHDRGVTSGPGLYFLGLPWQHTWGSGRLSGVAYDAAYLAECITTRVHTGAAPAEHLFRWIAGTSTSTYPRDDEWVAPRTVA